MTCYLCNSTIPGDQPFYNDYEKYVCKPCFKDAPRCFTCRFPGRKLDQVEGLGLECEFCQGQVIAEGADVAAIIDPLRPFLQPFGLRGTAKPEWKWTDRLEIRAMQTGEDLPPDEFIDDFLRFCYPVIYRDGALHALRRLTKPTLIVYGLVQLAAAEIAAQTGQRDLFGKDEVLAFSRGWCHWIGFQAAQRLGYDLEHRQMRKWPELGGQGDFDRWISMARFNKPAKMVDFFRANLLAMSRRQSPDSVSRSGD